MVLVSIDVLLNDCFPMLDVTDVSLCNAVAVQAPGIGTVRYSSSVSSSGQLPSVRASNPSTLAVSSVPLQRPGQTLCSTSVTTSPRITANQRQPIIVPGQAAPVFVGQFGIHNLSVSLHLIVPAVFGC